MIAVCDSRVVVIKSSFSLAVLDVNKLKVANDVFGHMAGDKLLLTIANYLSDIFDWYSEYIQFDKNEFV